MYMYESATQTTIFVAENADLVLYLSLTQSTPSPLMIES